YQRRQLLQQFQRRECDAGRPVRPGFRKAIDELAIGSFFKTLQRHGAPCCVPQQALQLITPVRWHLGVGVQRKPVDTGTAGARQCGAFPCIPKARANTSHPTPSTDRWAMMAPLSSPMLFLRLRTVYVLKGEERWQQIP